MGNFEAEVEALRRKLQHNLPSAPVLPLSREAEAIFESCLRTSQELCKSAVRVLAKHGSKTVPTKGWFAPEVWVLSSHPVPDRRNRDGTRRAGLVALKDGRFACDAQVELNKDAEVVRLVSDFTSAQSATKDGLHGNGADVDGLVLRFLKSGPVLTYDGPAGSSSFTLREFLASSLAQQLATPHS